MADDPRNPFVRLRPAHPRLMVTRENIARARCEIAKSPEGERIRLKVMAAADAAANGPPPTWDPTGVFQDATRALLRRMQSLGMAWLFQSDLRYVDRVRMELAVVCNLRDWNPSQFIDNAEMTHAVAIGYDWFYDQWTPAERDKWRAAIFDKGLRPGLAQLTGTPKPAWPSQTTNWNIVCNAGLMIGALAVAEEKDDLPGLVFQRCLNSVPTGFHGYSPDGSWDEGPGYWAYATEYAAYLLTSLTTALGHEFGLGDLPGFGEGGLFRMYAEGSAVAEGQFRKFFNFSDSPEEHRGSWCMRWLSLRFRQPMYNWMALKDRQSRPMDLLWFSAEEPDNTKSIPRNKVFQGTANVAMFRGAWDSKSAAGFQPWRVQPTDDVYLGIRAGTNSRETAHGHLDLGSFVLDALEVRWATDLQPVAGDYYLPGYFDVDQARRFRYYRTSTVGHNTLQINGFNQPLGVQTEIVGFRDESPGLVVAVVDLTSAYPDCLRVRRGFALIDGRHVLIVDEFTPKQEMTVAWQMHTLAAARGGTVAELRQTFNGALLKFFARLLEPQGVHFTVEDALVTQPTEPPNTGVCKIVATLPKVVNPTRIAVYLSPDEEPNGALPEPLNGPLWHWLGWTGKPPPPCNPP